MTFLHQIDCNQFRAHAELEFMSLNDVRAQLPKYVFAFNISPCIHSDETQQPLSLPPESMTLNLFPCDLSSGLDQIIEIVAQTMPHNTKLAVFDAVTSNTALVLPIKQLVELCRSR
jgi:hypothetical protein